MRRARRGFTLMELMASISGHGDRDRGRQRLHAEGAGLV